MLALTQLFDQRPSIDADRTRYRARAVPCTGLYTIVLVLILQTSKHGRLSDEPSYFPPQCNTLAWSHGDIATRANGSQKPHSIQWVEFVAFSMAGIDFKDCRCMSA
jgi:hypothetical protein